MCNLQRLEVFLGENNGADTLQEDFEPFMGESKVGAGAVYARFRQTLLEGISIAGREFGFLGFSGSGLKAATCWFVGAYFLVLTSSTAF